MLKKIIGLLLVLGSIALISFLMSQKKRPSFKSESINKTLKVIVEDIQPELNKILVTANGSLEPVWKTQLTSDVSGQVIEVANELLAGAEFNQGDVLLKIDPIRYKAEVDRIEAQVADAKRALAEEKVRSEKAEKDWIRVNPNRKAPEFTLRWPQLESARKNFESALSALKLAKNNLQKTRITAPYDGSVVSREINLGENVQPGTRLASIISSKELELVLTLRDEQIEVINNANIDSIYVFDSNDPDTKWPAQLIRVDQVIDSQSRWRKAYLKLEFANIETGAMPIAGQFLSAEFELANQKESLKVNERSLAVDGNIWIVNDDETLSRIKPKVLYKSDDKIVLETIKGLKPPIKVISFPTQSLLEGVKVQTEYLNAGDLDVQ